MPDDQHSSAKTRLWTIDDLAEYLVYSRSTVASMLSRTPDKLPPKVGGLGHPRWDPDAVRQWSLDQSRSKIRRGRPRKIVPL